VHINDYTRDNNQLANLVPLLNLLPMDCKSINKRTSKNEGKMPSLHQARKYFAKLISAMSGKRNVFDTCTV